MIWMMIDDHMDIILISNDSDYNGSITIFSIVVLLASDCRCDELEEYPSPASRVLRARSAPSPARGEGFGRNSRRSHQKSRCAHRSLLCVRRRSLTRFRCVPARFSRWVPAHLEPLACVARKHAPVNTHRLPRPLRERVAARAASGRVRGPLTNTNLRNV